MENKKLIKILLKDMSELEELIAEIKANRQFDALEMEFVHTRAKGILQLMQLFDSKQEAAPSAMQKEPEVSGNKSGKEQSVATSHVSVEKEHPAAEEFIKEPEKEEVQQEKPEQKQPGPPPVKMSGPGVMVREKPETSAGETHNESDDEVVLEEENEMPDAVSRLGDSFLKGKSLNDLITDQNKLEFKLSNRPVSSIQTAIGINDRFQYIRELFDGDNQKFMEAVKTLDSKQNIKEAVDYLRNNFKWKKNETSLKFVNLVKRRFIHD